MPLSEQEQRLLDEMERHLMNKDADVVSAPREGQSLSYRNIVYGTVLVLLGIGGLIGGVSSGLIVVGVIAFLVMVAGVVLAVTPAKNAAGRVSASHGGDKAPAGGAAKKSSGSSASFMDRMNDRWDRRHGED
ncbi:MAG: hypothetical protein ABS62_05195 [Microbacterium sp. SCN 70-200]|uniref:DUF3040 domain-containing protein n=1 Tax=unclassified Microbacterium TaxID=2609290 RepID=UPI00086EB16E|nr:MULTISPECIES: DUF3040 domain-containing protein [unclassified Microbacterium]MBN9215955.1 DUF3040 domain-containing protein [Microbacterium sp.]ODT41851.1 MAG: hypothetical protein ABS62_05195 [Microbacterium sp. SCN 70-200]OJV84540.1 MAG: hypothetical protein BGO46_06440 [Microbacterium sp. 70-16]